MHCREGGLHSLRNNVLNVVETHPRRKLAHCCVALAVEESPIEAFRALKYCKTDRAPVQVHLTREIFFLFHSLLLDVAMRGGTLAFSESDAAHKFNRLRPV